MKVNDALLWYRLDRFTADDVTRATGLSEAAQRLLLKLGILHPIPQARTKQRLLDNHMVKRAAVIGPLSESGLSLQVSGKIVASAFMLEDLLFDFIDPWDAAFDASGELDPATGLRPPRTQLRDCDKWINPDAKRYTEDTDYLISIIDSRFVIASGLGVLGELTTDLTDFIWWDNAMDDLMKSRVKEGLLQLSIHGQRDHWAPFGGFDRRDNQKTIEYAVKTPSDRDKKEAAQAKESPVSILMVNASLALRIALRRLLYIDADVTWRADTS